MGSLERIYGIGKKCARRLRELGLKFVRRLIKEPEPANDESQSNQDFGTETEMLTALMGATPTDSGRVEASSLQPGDLEVNFTVRIKPSDNENRQESDLETPLERDTALVRRYEDRLMEWMSEKPENPAPFVMDPASALEAAVPDIDPKHIHSLRERDLTNKHVHPSFSSIRVIPEEGDR